MNSKRFMTSKEIIEYMGYSESTFYRRLRNGKFPKPTKLPNRANVWERRKIVKYMDKAKEQGKTYLPKGREPMI